MNFKKVIVICMLLFSSTTWAVNSNDLRNDDDPKNDDEFSWFSYA